jgi:hypothetical protein
MPELKIVSQIMEKKKLSAKQELNLKNKNGWQASGRALCLHQFCDM